MGFTCVNPSGCVMFKVYETPVRQMLPRAMISPMDSPFGPGGSMACTCRADAVAFVDKMGGPRVAMTNKYGQINEYQFTLVLSELKLAAHDLKCGYFVYHISFDVRILFSI